MLCDVLSIREPEQISAHKNHIVFRRNARTFSVLHGFMSLSSMRHFLSENYSCSTKSKRVYKQLDVSKT